MEPARLTPTQFKDTRQALHYSQQHLANLLGVARSTLSHWEMGKDPIPYRVRAELESIIATQVDALRGLLATYPPTNQPT